jgi:plasmid maintenance system antidote protein VapI
MSYPYEFALHAETNRNRVYDTVLSALEQASLEHGTTQSKIASLIGRKPSQVSAWLSGPSNWTLDTVSDLLRAVGASMQYKVVFDKEIIPSNVKHPALVHAGAANSLIAVTSLSTQELHATDGTTTWQIIQQRTSHPVLYYGSGTLNTVSFTLTHT